MWCTFGARFRAGSGSGKLHAGREGPTRKVPAVCASGAPVSRSGGCVALYGFVCTPRASGSRFRAAQAHSGRSAARVCSHAQSRTGRPPRFPHDPAQPLERICRTPCRPRLTSRSRSRIPLVRTNSTARITEKRPLRTNTPLAFRTKLENRRSRTQRGTGFEGAGLGVGRRNI